ncbi:hypothetical protein [Kitasatospora sp. MBT63]|uniref:hypothetical protein n=1 Tax=Kitasatospora sp. MBT63 TaxID=1444768 RepID=UPI0011EA6B93|nr:hypothetical protein [Kitasatospora sp. MBT63]
MTSNQTSPESDTAAQAPLPRRKAGTHWKEPDTAPPGSFLPKGPAPARPDARTVAARTATFLRQQPDQRWLSVSEAFDSPSAVRPTSNGR